MTQETREQTGETVRAIWNQARTLKICLGEDIVQEETACQCPNDHHDIPCWECCDPPAPCDAAAWPRYNGPIVVSSDGRAHLCEDCVHEIDPEFVDAYEHAFSEVAQGETPYLGEWMDAMAAQFPTDVGVIERGPRQIDC